VIQIGNVQHPDVDEPRELRQDPFEPGEKRGVVQSPLGRVFSVPEVVQIYYLTLTITDINNQQGIP
jgi:hypothetical protein